MELVMALKFKSKVDVSVSPLFCDKLSFTIDYKTNSERAHIVSAAQELVSCKAAFRCIRSPYKKGIGIYQGNYPNRLRMLIQWDPKYPEASYLRVDFNPANADLDDVWVKLNHTLPGGIGDYLGKAVFTRLDAAADIYGYLPHQLAAYYPQKSITQTNSKSGVIETLYIGTKEDANRVVLYDKMRHVKEQKKKYNLTLPFPDCPTTRVEIRMKPCVGADDLLGIQNPFEKLLLRPVSAFQDDPSPLWKLFVAAVQARGAQDALLLLPECTRKSFKAKIEAASADWWQPIKLWEGWPTMVSKVLLTPAENPYLAIADDQQGSKKASQEPVAA